MSATCPSSRAISWSARSNPAKESGHPKTADPICPPRVPAAEPSLGQLGQTLQKRAVIQKQLIQYVRHM